MQPKLFVPLFSVLVLQAILPDVPAVRQTSQPPASAQSPDAMQRRDTTRDYLSQPRPGVTPVLFAEGLVSTADGMYGTVVFSPKQDEAFWAKDKRPELFFSRLVAGRWTPPSEFPFPEGYRLSSPFFSADGERLYFLAARHAESGLDQDDKIWVVDRVQDGWGAPRELDTLVNSVREMHWQFSVDGRGDVYFGGEGADLYVAEFQDGAYQAPKRLPSPINTQAPETSPNVSRDGSLLLFDRWFDSSPYIRIMVSFRSATGTWSEPIDLSPHLRTDGNDMAARLSPDEEYLFFQSQRPGSDPNRSVYWMKADFLNGLRQQAKWETR